MVHPIVMETTDMGTKWLALEGDRCMPTFLRMFKVFTFERKQYFLMHVSRLHISLDQLEVEATPYLTCNNIGGIFHSSPIMWPPHYISCIINCYWPVWEKIWCHNSGLLCNRVLLMWLHTFMYRLDHGFAWERIQPWCSWGWQGPSFVDSSHSSSSQDSSSSPDKCPPCSWPMAYMLMLPQGPRIIYVNLQRFCKYSNVTYVAV